LLKIEEIDFKNTVSVNLWKLSSLAFKLAWIIS